MARNSLIKEFNYEVNYDYSESDVKNVFRNKDELDILRRNILTELGNLSYKNEKITKELVLDVISEKTKGYNDNSINNYNNCSSYISRNCYRNCCKWRKPIW